MLQAATGDRSSALTRMQLEDLPISQHTFLEFINIQIGVDARRQNQDGQRTGGGGQDNVMIDGISAHRHRQQRHHGRHEPPAGRDRRSQAAHLRAIRPSTAARAACRSRRSRAAARTASAGSSTTTSATRTGTRTPGRRGRTASPGPSTRQRDWGYVIGGPVGKPGGNNKLFFFYTHEYRPRTAGNTIENYRMPTAEERRGDFSQTLDNNGALYNLIYDAVDRAAQDELLGDHSDRLLPGRRRRRPDSDQPALRPGHGDAQPVPAAEQSADRRPQLQPLGRRCRCRTLLTYTPDPPGRLSGVAEPARDLEVQRTKRTHRPGLHRNGSDARALPGFTDSINKFPLSFNTSGTVNYTINEHDVPRGHLRRQPEPPRHAVDQRRSRTEQRGLPAGPRGADRQLLARRDCDPVPGRRHRRSRLLRVQRAAADRHAVLRERPHPPAAAAQLGRRRASARRRPA